MLILLSREQVYFVRCTLPLHLLKSQHGNRAKCNLCKLSLYWLGIIAAICVLISDWLMLGYTKTFDVCVVDRCFIEPSAVYFHEAQKRLWILISAYHYFLFCCNVCLVLGCRVMLNSDYFNYCVSSFSDY